MYSRLPRSCARASGTGIAEAALHGNARALHCAANIQVAANTDVRLPLETPAPTLDRLHFSLLEVIDRQPVRDHFGNLAIADGQLLIRHLPPGDFILRQLRLNGPKNLTDDITLHVSAGVEQDGLLISANRIMPRVSPVNPSITKAAAENGQLTLQLRDAGPHTRVTVVGKRYTFEGWEAGWAAYHFLPALSDIFTPGFEGCGYLTEQKGIVHQRSDDIDRLHQGAILPQQIDAGIIRSFETDQESRIGCLRQSTKSCFQARRAQLGGSTCGFHHMCKFYLRLGHKSLFSWSRLC